MDRFSLPGPFNPHRWRGKEWTDGLTASLYPLPLVVLGRWSVDSDEVAKFAAMAQKWWDPFGPFMPLQQMNPIRV